MKQNLSTMHEKIETLSFSSNFLEMQMELEGIRLQAIIHNLKATLSFLNLINSSLNSESKLTQEKTEEKIEELKKFKESLIETHKQFEELKKDIITFQNYEGKLKNSMYKNTEYREDLKDKNECDITKIQLNKEIK